jgi:large subunit ribosomal protein L15
MQTHTLKRKIKNAKKKLVGRGGTRGKTSGRGHKGQKARAGHSLRPAFLDMIKKLPKLRGHGKNRAQTVDGSKDRTTAVSISSLEAFTNGDVVSPKTLEQKGIIERRNGKLPRVKILAKGEFSRKITIVNCEVSKVVKEKVQALGGSVKA